MKPTEFMRLPLHERQQLMSDAVDQLIAAGYYKPEDCCGTEQIFVTAASMADDLARVKAELDDQRALNRNLAATTAKMIAERDRYRQALVEINEKSTILAGIVTTALKEKE